MSEQDQDEIKRGSLLKHIGITSVAALAGVAGVEEEADAEQHPWDIIISNNGRTLRHLPPPPTPPAEKKKLKTVQYQWFAIYSAKTLPNPLPADATAVIQIPTPYISGTDEDQTDHSGDAPARKLTVEVFLVLGPPV